MVHRRIRQQLPTVLGALLAGALSAVSPTAPAAAYPLNRCAPSENGAPVLDRVHVTQRVDVRRASARIRVIVKAHDTGGPGVRTGIRAAAVTIPSRTPIRLAYVGHRWWEGFTTIRRWSERGAFLLNGVQLADGAVFPYRFYDDDEEETEYDVDYRTSGEHSWAGVGGDRTFRVRSVPDRTSPRITGFGVRPPSVDTRTEAQSLVVTARATDTISGVRSAQARFFTESSQVYIARLLPVAGSRDLLRGRLTVPRNVGTGDWIADELEVRDRADNLRAVGTRTLGTPGYPNRVHVTSDPVPPPDVTSPSTTTSITVSDSRVDVSTGDQTVTYRIRVVNPVRPVGHVGLSLGQPERSFVRFGAARLVSGDAYDGIWEVSATVDSCVALSGTVTPAVTPEPQDGVTVPSFELLAGDNTEPTMSGAVSGGRIAVSFSEDVNGISAASLRVLRASYRAIPGHWSCGPGTVTCTDGPVRTATFTPTDPLPARGRLEVRPNPDHHLELTDRAGNPARRSLWLR